MNYSSINNLIDVATDKIESTKNLTGVFDIVDVCDYVECSIVSWDEERQTGVYAILNGSDEGKRIEIKFWRDIDGERVMPWFRTVDKSPIHHGTEQCLIEWIKTESYANLKKGCERRYAKMGNNI